MLRRQQGRASISSTGRCMHTTTGAPLRLSRYHRSQGSCQGRTRSQQRSRYTRCGGSQRGQPRRRSRGFHSRAAQPWDLLRLRQSCPRPSQRHLRQGTHPQWQPCHPKPRGTPCILSMGRICLRAKALLRPPLRTRLQGPLHHQETARGPWSCPQPPLWQAARLRQ